MTVWPRDDENIVEDIYNKYKRLMFATAKKFTDDPSDQEDIVQTALERLVKLFSASGSAKRCVSAGYIVYTVRSVSIDFLRKQAKETEHHVYVEEDKLAGMVRTDGTLDDLLFPSERAEDLREIWPRLSAEDRILLEGKYILGQTDRELAAILHCGVNSVRMKLTRARRQAIKLLSERSGSSV